MKPLIFAACDDVYHKKYALPLKSSASLHGLKCEIVNGGTMGPVEASVLRYRLLPDVLRVNESVLVLDVDSVINDTISINPRYDIGLFLREDFNDSRKKVMGSVFYINQRAIKFAIELQERLARVSEWFDDQSSIYRLYQKHRGEYSYKIFGTDFINWHCTPATIWTGKGKTKDNPVFLKELARYA